MNKTYSVDPPLRIVVPLNMYFDNPGGTNEEELEVTVHVTGQSGRAPPA